MARDFFEVCPNCSSINISVRQRKTPKYHCRNCRNEFDILKLKLFKKRLNNKETLVNITLILKNKKSSDYLFFKLFFKNISLKTYKQEKKKKQFPLLSFYPRFPFRPSLRSFRSSLRSTFCFSLLSPLCTIFRTLRPTPKTIFLPPPYCFIAIPSLKTYP